MPLRMYVEDFDGNGILEQIVTYIDSDGRERLFATRDELVEQLPYIGERFSTYREFAAADLTERSEEHTSELQSRGHLVCRRLLEIKYESDRFMTQRGDYEVMKSERR